MARKLLLISHYAQNKGTTDYLISFLRKHKQPFYYLRHPLPETSIQYSELLKYENGTEQLIRKYKRKNSFILKTLHELYINLKTTLAIQKEIKAVVAFGAINLASVGYLRATKTRLVFWGVDYSSSRFNNTILDTIYRILETLACMIADRIAQPNQTQADMRITMHHAAVSKIVLIPNGISPMPFKKTDNKDLEVSLLYVGSLSPQHGVLNFIKVVLSHNLHVKLRVYGDGTERGSIEKYIKKHELENISLLGSVAPSQIRKFIASTRKKFIGIAPYIMGSHVQYGDSLKIKEYINLGIPYITSNVVMLDPVMLSSGYVYKDISEVSDNLEKVIATLDINVTDRNQMVKKYDWDTLFSNGLGSQGLGIL